MRARPEQWPRVNELFAAAAELQEPERTQFLEQECADDPALRAEVESLLASDAESSDFIEEPVGSVPLELFSESSAEIAGQQFGAYRIVREIGRGGLGTVYLAERADDEYRKEVALKLVRRGLDTEDILRRFRHERQILAQLDHPNIARLIDGGTTDDGLPYFVMEYVQGATLLEYCDAQNLDTNGRLRLFRKVCDAVSYAHQNLVIHRDLKPSNILVTEDSESVRERGGTPKLLDFGIAKLLTPEEEAMTQTMPALRVMTPEYASPEQINGGKITTSSDVYSLGVLLYELLTGQKPYRLTSRSAEEMSRAITEQEPSRPSMAGNPKSQTPNPKRLSSDLDHIILMALRKEPERRYTTVERFSEDIRRHLEGLPVSAHRDTFQYRATKFVRRNKAPVVAALLVLLALFSGLIATLWQARVAQAQRTKAERRFNDVRKLANSNLFAVYPKIENLAGSLEAQQAILLNVLQYLDSLFHEAGDDLELQSELATAYEKVGDVQGAKHDQSLGNYKTGLETYLKAQQLREAVSLADPGSLEAKTKLAQNYYVIARTYWFSNRTKEAEAIYAKGIKLRRELVAATPDSIDANNGLAIMLINAGAIPEHSYQTTEALVYFDEALAIIQKMRAQHPENRDLKQTLSLNLKFLGRSKAALKEYDEAQSYLQQALAISQELAKEFPQDFRLQRDVWISQKQVCQFFINKDDGEGAVPACLPTTEFPRLALEKEPENASVQHDLSVSQWDVARAFSLAKNYPGAVEAANEAIATISGLIEKLPGNTSYQRYLAIYLTAKGEALVGLNQFDPSLATLREAEEILRRLSELDPASTSHQWDLSGVYRLAAKAHSGKGEKAAAVEKIEKAIAIVQTLAKLDALAGSEQKLFAELEAEKKRVQQDVTRSE